MSTIVPYFWKYIYIFFTFENIKAHCVLISAPTSYKTVQGFECKKYHCPLLLKILKSTVCWSQLQHPIKKSKDLNARAEVSTLENQDYLLHLIDFQNMSYLFVLCRFYFFKYLMHFLFDIQSFFLPPVLLLLGSGKGVKRWMYFFQWFITSCLMHQDVLNLSWNFVFALPIIEMKVLWIYANRQTSYAEIMRERERCSHIYYHTKLHFAL